MRAATDGATGRVAVGVRPEKIALGEGGANASRARSQETAYIGVATAGVVDTPSGDITVFHQNADAGGVVPAAGDARDLSWSARRRRSSSIDEEEPADDHRCARGASSSSAARPARRPVAPGPARRLRRRRATAAGGGDELQDVLNFANWPLYIDIDEDDEEAPDARPVQGRDRDQGQLLRGRSTTTPSTSRRSRARSRRATGSAATSSSSTDNSRFPGLSSTRTGCRSSTRT